MGLRLRINLLITLMMLLFAAGLGRMVYNDARNSIHEEIEAGTRVTGQMLSGVVYASQITGTPRPFLFNFLQQLGRVRANHIRLWDTGSNSLVYESPPSKYKVGREAPEWYGKLMLPQTEALNILLPGARIEVIPDPSRAILDAWDDFKRVLMLGAGFFVLVNLLVFWFVSRSLKPLQHILQGLSEMERGKLDTRLPQFHLPEFRRISDAFNRMATTLHEAIGDNRRLALAVEQSSDAILIHGPNGRISFWNPAAERLFGYGKDEVIAQPVALLAAEDRRKEVGEHQETVARRDRIVNLWTRRLTKNGEEIDVALSAAPLVDPDTDRVVGGIVSHRDITAQIRAQAAENELKQNRELSQLIRSRVEEERRGIAQELHDELGQCVTAIRTIAESITKRSGDGAPEIKSQAQSINQIAGRIYDGMHNIVRRLRPAELDILGLTETLRETVSGWAARYPGIAFDLKLGGDFENLGEAANITIYRLVQEALTNIARHANASRVEVALTRDASDTLTLSIRDNGHGNVSMEMSGGGFGLLGMRERVQALNGEFSVSGKPGQGTEVRAVLPMTQKNTEETIP